ncbi:hypothetical protein K1719_025605 [Acacia pycnantha]|nr:hypothetical protein K1719_025605 [Acacia pycnantha]
MQARSEAAVLLKQLDFTVENLKEKLLQKLKQSIKDIQLNPEEINNASTDPSSFASAHEAAVREFVEAVCASRAIFPDSEKQLNNILLNT